MLSEICPQCKTPLFRLANGEVICPTCGRRVVFAKSTEAEKVAAQTAVASSLEDVVVRKISALQSRLDSTEDLSELEKEVAILSALFDLLERVRKAKL